MADMVGDEYSHFKNDKIICSQEIIFFEIIFRTRGHYMRKFYKL